MKMINIYHHGMLIQKVEAAKDNIDKLKALAEYMKFAHEVQDDMHASHQREKVHFLGKTAD